MSDPGDEHRDDARDRAHFETAHLTADLKGHLVRGGAAALASEGGVFLLKLGVTAVLARLLTPDDFGVFAMVVVMTRLIGLFKDLGLSVATVQREEVTHAQVSSLFWVNVGVSILLALLSAALAPAVAAFYGDARLTPVMLLLSLGYVFGGLGAQHGALLRRKLRFGTLARIAISAEAAGAALAVAAALLGLGYWALVVQVLASEAFRALGCWIASDWRPGPPSLGGGIGSMVAFGGHLTGARVLGYVQRNLDNVLIGKRWGSASLGTYALAYQLLLLPVQRLLGPIGQAAVPALSRIQGDVPRLRRAFGGILRAVAYLVMPGVALTAATAHDLVVIVLGSKWLAVGDVYQALAVIGFMQPLTGVRWLLISQGRARRIFVWALIASPMTVLGIVLGLPHGPLGVAVALSVVSVLRQVPSQYFLLRGMPVSAGAVFLSMARPALLALAAGGTAWTLRHTVIDARPLIALPVALAAGLAVAGGLILLVPAYRADLSEIASTFRHLRPGRKAPPDAEATDL